jgi:beta-aspartyl-peptidase (threonine type)
VIALVVHGGAGAISPERHARVTAGCAAAAEAGFAVLGAGGRALDAVQAAVRVLEDDPELNAGTGSVLTRDGTVEVDAAIMDGPRRAIGAVAAVPDLRAPIDLARAVLDDGEHVLLAGPAAWRFAAERGIAPVPTATLITERSRTRWRDEAARRAAGAVTPPVPAEGGTVGAVALDAQGRLAAATSTGGVSFKRAGRVGDTPLPGCGTWADDHSAASATGDGEAIIRVTLCRVLAQRVVGGDELEVAAAAALDELVAHGGSGGVIAVDRGGRVVAAHASPTMSFAAVVDDGGGARRVAGVSTAGTRLAALLT